MHQTAITAKLLALPSKREFCRRHNLPARTLWRLISGGNPTQSTLVAFAKALRVEARRKGIK